MSGSSKTKAFADAWNDECFDTLAVPDTPYVGATFVLAAARCDNGLGPRPRRAHRATGMCDRSTVCCAHTLFPPPHESARMSGSVQAWLPGADHQYCGSSFRSSPR